MDINNVDLKSQLGITVSRSEGATPHFWELNINQLMWSSTLIDDLGLVKAYKLDFTPNHTPRLEQVEEIVLEEAHSRLLDKVTDEAGRHGSPTQKNWGRAIGRQSQL